MLRLASHTSSFTMHTTTRGQMRTCLHYTDPFQFLSYQLVLRSSTRYDSSSLTLLFELTGARIVCIWNGTKWVGVWHVCHEWCHHFGKKLNQTIPSSFLTSAKAASTSACAARRSASRAYGTVANHDRHPLLSERGLTGYYHIPSAPARCGWPLLPVPLHALQHPKPNIIDTVSTTTTTLHHPSSCLPASKVSFLPVPRALSPRPHPWVPVLHARAPQPQP